MIPLRFIGSGKPYVKIFLCLVVSGEKKRVKRKNLLTSLI